MFEEDTTFHNITPETFNSPPVRHNPKSLTGIRTLVPDLPAQLRDFQLVLICSASTDLGGL
jgi:hypothetical protein